MLCFCHSQIQIRAAAGSERKRLAVNLKPGALVASDRPLIPGANDEIQWFSAGTFPGNNIRHLKDLSPVMHSAVLRIYTDADKYFIILLPEANITNEKISVPKTKIIPLRMGIIKPFLFGFQFSTGREIIDFIGSVIFPVADPAFVIIC